ncbi:hypothetical protein ABZX85_02695 [Streptomyces sp. NPDC004539]|uniref:hypothetical protein n=1 Tax=Streptomyces sp. NPDC004539 TaxID=3154280 RepID=UPI0033B4EA22
MAAIGAGLWSTWSTRTRRSRGDGPELDGYARFRAAMERPLGREATFHEPPFQETPLKDPAPRNAALRDAAFEDAHENVPRVEASPLTPEPDVFETAPPRDDAFPAPALEGTAPTNSAHG